VSPDKAFMDVLIVGAGGHGKVVLDILREAGKHTPVGFIDADTALAGTTVGGLPVFGPANQLPKLRAKKIGGAIIAIGENRARQTYAVILREQNFELINAIHPAASVSRSAIIGRNVVIAAHAVVCAEAAIGDSTIINTAAVVDHECEIGLGAHICPTAALAGRVRVGEGAFIGLGAKIISCVTIGQHAIVGAGAVVISDVSDDSTVVGVPARIVKTAARHAAA
jgi:sugar O-acyltransferase (sialic acid O-acetyltransferase NeuD family)